jgi:hypothetical protein
MGSALAVAAGARRQTHSPVFDVSIQALRGEHRHDHGAEMAGRRDIGGERRQSPHLGSHFALCILGHFGVFEV